MRAAGRDAGVHVLARRRQHRDGVGPDAGRHAAGRGDVAQVPEQAEAGDVGQGVDLEAGERLPPRPG